VLQDQINGLHPTTVGMQLPKRHASTGDLNTTSVPSCTIKMPHGSLQSHMLAFTTKREAARRRGDRMA
jgi:hypothetical protein